MVVALTMTSVGGVVGCRRSLLKKSGCRTPRIELEEIGPSLDLVMRRTHLASDDLYKLAHRQPKALKVSHMTKLHPPFPSLFSSIVSFSPSIVSFFSYYVSLSSPAILLLVFKFFSSYQLFLSTHFTTPTFSFTLFIQLLR